LPETVGDCVRDKRLGLTSASYNARRWPFLLEGLAPQLLPDRGGDAGRKIVLGLALAVVRLSRWKVCRDHGRRLRERISAPITARAS